MVANLLVQSAKALMGLHDLGWQHRERVQLSDPSMRDHLSEHGIDPGRDNLTETRFKQNMTTQLMHSMN